MLEHEHTPELCIPSRDDAVEALRKFAERGVGDPAKLELGNAEVITANRVVDSWHQAAERAAQSNPAPDALIRHHVSRTTLEVDAGFRGASFLDEVANDMLNESFAEAEDAGLDELAAEIQAKRAEINALIDAEDSTA